MNFKRLTRVNFLYAENYINMLLTLPTFFLMYPLYKYYRHVFILGIGIRNEIQSLFNLHFNTTNILVFAARV